MLASILKNVVGDSENLAAFNSKPGLLECLPLSTLEETLPMFEMAARKRPLPFTVYNESATPSLWRSHVCWLQGESLLM